MGRYVLLAVAVMSLLPASAWAFPTSEPAYGRLPLQFAANQGQTDPQVKFLARGSGSALFITPAGATLTLGQNKATVHLALAGSSPSALVTGEAPLKGRSNYLIGRDPKRWRIGIANYARVRCRDVYPGIDMVYYGNQEQLEYDFVVAPQANPGLIHLRFGDGPGVHLDAGSLVVQTAAGPMRWHKPNVYQDIGGKRQSVDGGYRLDQGNTVLFALGAYDKTKPLVIDPTCVYSTFLGGTGDDSGSSIAADAAGNAYIAGNTTSADFPTVNTGADVGYTGDMFVAKMAPDGSSLLYSTYIGSPASSGFESVDGIAVDAEGCVYVTGHTMSTNFPTTSGTFQPQKKGPPFVSGSVFCNYNTFIVKLSPDGSRLAYSTFLGGTMPDLPHNITVDSRGDAYVTGETDSPDFPVTGARPNMGSRSTFLTKLNAEGTGLVYSLIFPQGDRPALAIDRAGSAYLTGRALGGLPVTPGAYQTRKGRQSNACAFAVKFDPEGRLVYCTFLSGTKEGGEESGTGIAVDGAGEAYVTGSTESTDFPVVHAAQPTKGRGGGSNAFLSKLSADGRELLFSTYLGGSLFDDAYGVAVDPQGNAWITGMALSSDFPVVNPLQALHGGHTAPDDPAAPRPTVLDLPRGLDAFVAKFSPDGDLLFSTYLGGSDADRGQSIATDSSGHVYVTGSTASDDFPVYHAGQAVKRRGEAGLEGYSANINAFIVKITDTP